MERAEKIAVSLAILLLSIGIVSAITLPEEKMGEEKMGDYIEVNGEKLYMDEIFEKCIERQIEAMGENYTGISLACIINLSNVGNPEEHEYSIIGADGYQKTVSWEDMKKGILTEKRRTIFPHLRKAFWVGDVIKIEVI